MKNKLFLGFTVIFILGVSLVGCDNGTPSPDDENDGQSISITVTNLPENGESVIWLSSDNSGNSAFFKNLKAGGTTTVSENTGTFLLKKPTADIVSGFTDENWTETGSFYMEVGFGKKSNGQWERSWGSPDKINISNEAIISANDWLRH
jgi:hypothetical protein